MKALIAAVLVLSANAAQAHDTKPFSHLAFKAMMDTAADLAVASPMPLLKAGGYAYKIEDVALDISEAGVEREGQVIDAEILMSGHEATQLRLLTDQGAGNSEAANKLKAHLREREFTMTRGDRAPLGYTLGSIVRHLPYAAAEVTIDKVFEKVFAFGMEKLGGALFSTKAAHSAEEALAESRIGNWYQHYHGGKKFRYLHVEWNKLNIRDKALDEAIRDHASEIAEKLIENNITDFLKDTTSDMAATMYHQIMTENPSRVRRIVVASMVAAPVPVMIPAAAAPLPVMRAAPASDPVIRAIDSEQPSLAPSYQSYYDNPAPAWSTTEREHDPPPQTHDEPPIQSTEAPEEPWVSRYHEELMRVGDGKTFDVCSNGCPNGSSQSSWDGRKGQTLTNGN